MTGPITHKQALEFLGKLQEVAPHATGEKLGQIARLIEGLAAENQRLSALLPEGAAGQSGPGVMDVQSVQAGAVPVVSVANLSSGFNDLTEKTAVSPGENLLNGVNESLRPPLIAIRGRAELVQAGFLGAITPEQDQWLQSIQENTRRAFSLLDTIEQIIALQRGIVRLDVVNFLATDLMTEAWNRLRDKSNAAGHEINLEVPTSVPLARGDFYHALMILADLLENAILYTPPGGHIRLVADNLSSHVLFTVIDTGIGLTPSDQAHVGQAFWRGHHHRLVRQHPGSGLRLYLARDLLTRMGGELIYSGQPGQGSTFSFTLPVA